MIKTTKKSIFIIFIIILSLFLGSCGGRELDSLGIVVSMGFDDIDGEIITTNEVINPNAMGQAQGAGTLEKTLFIKSRGQTITEAIDNTKMTFDRELYFPHNNLFIIGESIAKKGLDGPLDFLSRDNEQREEAYMLVAKESNAYDVMGINSGLSESPGRYLNQIVNEKVTNGKSRSLTISNFFKYYYRKKQGYTLGIVEVIDKQNIDEEKDKEKIKVLSIEGGAVFKDNKLIGYFNGDEMMGFNFIVDQFKQGLIVFNSPKEIIKKGEDLSDTKNLSSFEVFKTSTKKRVEIVDGKLHLSMDVNMRGGLTGIYEGLDISRQGVIEIMEKACGEKVKSLMMDTFEKAKKTYNTDTFGIATLVQGKYPKLWRQIEDQWPNIFRDLDYKINVKVRFNDTGYTNIPSTIRKDKNGK